MVRSKILGASLAALLAATPALSGPLNTTGVFMGHAASGVAIDTSTGINVQAETSVGTGQGANLGVTNPTAMTHAWWTFVTGGTNYTGPTTWWGNYLFSSQAGTNCEAAAGFAAGICDTYETVVNVHFRVNYNDSTGTPSAHGIEGSGSDPTTTPVNGVWEFRLVTIDAAGNHHATVINDTNVDSSMTWNPFSNITIDLNNAGNNACGGFFIFAVPNAGCSTLAGSTGWMNDLYINNVYMGCTGVGTPATIAGVGAVTCTAANTVPIEVIRKFRTAAGMPPLHTNTCDDVNGVQALVCHFGSGDAFLTEHGSATFGAFSAHAQSAAVTLSGDPTPAAPYGPSGIPANTVAMKLVEQMLSGACTGSGAPFHDCTAASQFPGSTMGSNVAVGDFILIAVETNNSGGGAPTATPTCPASFSTTSGGAADGGTLVGPVFDSGGASPTNAEAFFCYGFATTTTGAYPIAFTGTAGNRVGTLTLVFANVAAVDATPSISDVSAASTTWTTPNQTTTAANDDLIAIYFGSTTASNALTPNTGRALSLSMKRSSGGNAYVVATDRTIASPSTVNDNGTMAPSSRGLVGSIALKHN